jgi:glycosyl transferase family 25
MLKTYCINLDHRQDRWQECIANYGEYGVPVDQVERISGVRDEDFGALGCAKSHMAVLSRFLSHESSPYCLVLEDDFNFHHSWNDFISGVNRLNAEGVGWDVILLGATAVVPKAQPANGFSRVFEAQSAVAYMVRRDYVFKLLGCFAESISPMELLRPLHLRTWAVSRFAIDVAWKRLQCCDHWYIFHPAIGKQRASYSDIEMRNVDYDNVAYPVGNS